MTASLVITLFGGFRAWSSDGKPLVFPGRKGQLLLAYLAVHAGETQTRDKVISLLWSDRGETQARGSLRQELTALRKTLGNAAPRAIVIDGERLSLDPSTVGIDVREFEALIQSDATADLTRAAEMYKGPFLDGLSVRDSACEEWLQHERERLRLLLLGVLERLLARQLKTRAWAQATATAEAILAHDTLREDVHRTLMQLHAAQGHGSLALRQYRMCVKVLEDSLGVEPEPETQRLHQEIQAQRVSSAPLPAIAPNIDTPEIERPSIAVLPFANISGDPKQDYFADGLTEDIITDLSRVSALFVIARNTVFTFKGKAVQVQQVARALTVDYVLEGSVRMAGERVRITVQLVDGRSGGHLWADRFDRSLDDIFALQDDISRNIVGALKIKLLPGELATIANRPTSNAEAYQYYLMGRSFFLRSGWGPPALKVARQMFAKATEIDPWYARAFAGIANCDSYLVCMGDPGASFEDILASSERALALDANLAEAHAAKGLALYTAGRHGEANAVFERAVRFGPDLFEAHFFAARNFRAQGRHAEAVRLFERAAELQPDDFRALGLAVNAYRSLGRGDDMRSAVRRCLERVEAELAVHPDNAGALAFGAAMLGEIGETASAEAWAARAAEIAPLDSITNYNLACAYAGLGMLNAALERLQQVFSDPPFSRRSHIEWMKHDSSLERLREHPEYQALLRRLEAEAS
ncbi:MAG: tetratricopeptide repeat protein [Proteobacteria bacterium]|nr:tetratricopeptide repeat protein [Pseudomonadota bacterium]